ncbi:RNA 2',3'-cyclic phosphodiesterase [Polymorphobacter sp.]|uniref:RNA 2',3'-cyclic phosphodiesterase n=1 Tax=Polymorphobacter sp. TaxID=1909290 RepID=UPI003F70E1BD
MHRLFVALELPLPVRDALLSAQGGVSGARWQRDDQLHLTLRYIGEVDRHQAQDIAAALATVNFQPFTLSLATPGTFDRRGRIDTLWVGVSPHADVTALARRIDAALTRIGIPPQTRAFLPHITVARGRLTGPIDGFPAHPLPSAPFALTSFALWESRPGPDGSDYAIIERYPIR